MFIRKITKPLFVVAFLLAICATASFAQEAPGERVVLSIGSERINEAEIMRIIVDTMSGNQMMTTLMLSKSTVEDRRKIVSDLSEALLFAVAAVEDGYLDKPAVAAEIRWQIAKILIDAYYEDISAKWDFSEAAIEKYYKAHLADFMQSEAFSIAQIVTDTESQALMAVLETKGNLEEWPNIVEKYSIDTDKDAGELQWVEKGELLPEVEEAIMSAKPGDIVGPVKSEDGWHVLFVEGYRPARQKTLDEAVNDVGNAMESEYIESVLSKTRERHPVEIDDEVLSTLGGIPALTNK